MMGWASAILVLAALVYLAIPRFNTFAARARTTEAQNALKSIAKLEIAYHDDFDAYTPELDKLGFYAPSTARYAFSVTTDGKTGFVAKAVQRRQGVLAQCDSGADEWQIDEKQRLKHVADGFASCY